MARVDGRVGRDEEGVSKAAVRGWWIYSMEDE